MVKLSNNIFHSNKFLNFVQRIFRITKRHAHYTHKTIIHCAYKNNHHWRSYIHILLLLIIFYTYSITAFNKADDITVPMEQAPIVIENEPAITSEEVTAETLVLPEATGEVLTGMVEVVSGVTEIITGEITTGEIITGEIITGTEVSTEIITGEVSTGASMISGSVEFFSGVLSSLSGEELYNLSGDVIGQVTTQSGNITPVNMSGVSLITQELSTIYPTQQIQINGSGFIQFNSLESVTTTGGEIGATYCSRITYENISSILKAGIWTWRETNDFVVQGDTEQIISMGIINKTLIEISSGDLIKIFTGDTFATNAQVYDIYIDFISNGKKVYHRITVVYTDDKQRYILDPLRGARTTTLQNISDYLGYYTDETDVYRYIGQGYSPSAIKSGFTIYENILELLQQIPGEEILTGGILSGEVTTGENITGVVITGEQIISTGNIITGTVIPEIISGVVSTGTTEQSTTPIETPTLGGGETLQIPSEITGAIETGAIEILTDEEIITGYFTKAYDKGVYSEKIIELQNIFNRMQLYTGAFDGIYSDSIISSVYQYQLMKNVLTAEDSIGLRGYLGPKTRQALNTSYVEYQIYEISLAQQLQEQIISTGQISTTGSISTETGIIENLSYTGQETWNEVGILSGMNIAVLFDPLVNPLLFSGIFNISGMNLSGLYTTGSLVGLMFDTTDEKIILHYLYAQGYQTGTLTLMPVRPEALIGDTALDFSLLSGKLLLPVILQSTNTLSGNIAEVSMPEGVILKTTNDKNFTGELKPPVFQDPEIVQQQVDQEVISVIDVGSDQHVQFEDGSGNVMYATFRVPAPGMNIGDTIDINYSEDGINRIYMSSVDVQDIDGEPYAIFEANHFTTFYLGNTTGTFVINNDASTTSGLAVTLNSNVTGATHMRFGNTIAERDSASWVSYVTGYAWNLTGSDEIKRVYAQFSGNAVVRNVSDGIIYDTTSGTTTSGLQLHLDGSTGTNLKFYDIGPRNLSFTGVGNAHTSTRSGEEVIFVDGNGDYIQNTSGFITGYPFTISAWIKTSRVNVTQTIAMFGNSATNTTYYGIRLVNANAVAVGSNTTARSATSAQTLIAGQRYHIIGVFSSSTSRTIYVDNASSATNTSTASFSATNPRRRVGRHPGTSTTNYFSGNIDEVRVYNKALTVGERQAIFMDLPTFDTQTAFTGTPTLYGSLGDKIISTTLVINGITYATTGDGPGKWKTNPIITGIANGTYNVTLNYTNVYGKTGSTIYTSGLIINSTGVTVTYNPSLATTGNVIATLTGLDPTYMIVNNSGSELYTFTGNGNFTWQYVDKQGVTGSTTATVDWIKSVVLNYSTGIFYENIGTNNGSINTNIIATLSTGAFSGVVANYVILANVPAGLTGVFTLSGTKDLIITLSGNATSHAATDSISNLGITFLTGAFVNMNPSDVGNATMTDIAVQFIDPEGYISGQQLRINGTLSGGQFYDYSPVHNATTLYGGLSNSTRSGETVMGTFNGTTQYVAVGTYTLPNYSISVRFNSSVVDAAYRTIIGSNGVDGLEISKNTSNNIVLYYNSILTSTTTIQANKRYHLVMVKNSTGTKLYINGVLENSNAYSAGLTSLPIAVGRWATSQYRNGKIDEVKIYDSAINQTQIDALYMMRPSFSATTVHTTGTITLNGLASDTQMALSLTISGTTYPATNNQNGTRTVTGIGPLAYNIYDVQLNYTNVYGATGTLMYIDGLANTDIGFPTATVSYNPSTLTTGNVIATLTGFNKTGITVVNNSGLTSYTFTGNGSFIFQLIDGEGATGSTTATVDRIRSAVLTYSTGVFHENSTLNNGSISGNIVVTLSTGAFSGAVANYVSMTNLPPDLIGVFTLSGTNQLLISLTGTALSHESLNSVSDVTITFLTGAFVNMNPSDVGNFNITGISVEFIDAIGSITGQQLRVDGTLSGGQFYDRSPSHRATTQYSVSTASQSGETVMSFNNTSSYIDIGSYTLSNYTITARFKGNSFGTYDTIIGNGNAGVSTYEMIDVYGGKVDFYSNGGLSSTESIVAGKWYHVALVQTSTGTQMYINGVYDKSNASIRTLSSAALAIGTDLRWSQWRDGDIDEVKIYDTPLTAPQISYLYMIPPSFVPRTTIIATPDLRGPIPDHNMALSLIISGTTYPTVNNQDGTRSALHIGPFASGTYDVQLNYTNAYGRTGMVFYTGGLIVDPQIHILYTPATSTSGNVVATVTGNLGRINNNGGSPDYTFTGNGQFTFELENLSGDTATITAIVDWIEKASLSYSTTGWLEKMMINDGTISGNIIATLSTGAFTGNITNYATITNLPAGLTGVFTLSGTNKVVISLTGTAVSHAAANSVSNIAVNFLDGAFVDLASNVVQGSTKTGLSVTFYDPNPSGGMYASDDVVLDADNAESNGCGAGACQEYNYGQTTYGGVSDFGSKFLIKFNIAASVPAGATVTSATLRLGKKYLGGGAPTDDGTGFKLRKIINNPGWIEGTKDTTLAGTGEPNYKQRKWNQENWYNGDPGLIAGIDYDTTDLMNGGGFTGSATASYTQTFPLNSAGIVAIQDWVYNSGNNQGFAVVEANKNWIYIYSDEDATASNRPLLTVSYVADTTAPQISSVTPLDNSSGVVLDLHPTITFDEYVSAVSGKNIYIKKSVDNSILETINVGNPGLVVLSLDNTLVTILPTTNLSSNTGYYIQIDSGAFVDRANNAFTGITSTTTWNFASVDTASVPNVTTPSITGLGYTTVTLGGTITSTGTSSVTEFGVVRGLLPGFNLVGANTLSQTGSYDFTGAFSLSIAGFNSGTTIYFRAFASNAAGTGYSSETGFTLKPDTVQFNTTTMMSNDTFTVNWIGVTGANYYQLYVSTGAACTSYISGYGPIISTGTSQRINNLEKETTYYYKIFAVNSGGTSPISEIHSTTTSFLPRPRVRLKFEETAGAVAYDSSENFNYGVISGFPIMQISGADNKAYNFDGVDDFVSITDLLSMDPSLTVTFRFQTSTTGNNQHIFSRGNDTGANSINIIFDGASQSLKTYINGSQTILNVTGALYTGLLDNQRHFYSLTIDDDDVSGKKLSTVYLDGITKLTNNTLNSGAFDPTTNVFIGRRADNSAGTYFSGNVDDVRIYGKILTSPEINNLYLMFVDITKPTGIVTYVPASGARTNGNVVATVTGFSETGIVITNNGGSANYTFTGNGSFTFTFRDQGFNTGEVIATVNWIDKVSPTFTGVITGGIYDYSSSGRIISFADNNSGVTAILKTYSMTGILISSGYWTSGTPLIASGHYDYELVVTDAAGNTTGAWFHIHYLTFTTVYIPGSGARTSGDVLAFLTGFSEEVTDFNSTGHIFTGNGSFVFSFYHPEGLDTHYFTATVYWIDKTVPVISGVTSGGYYTGVTITFSDANISGAILSGLDNLYYSGNFQNGSSIAGNGIYRVTAYDFAGNSTSSTFTIDTIPPTFTGVVTGGTYDDQVIIYFTDNNSGVTAVITTYSLGSGSTIVTSGVYVSGTPFIASGHYNYIFTVTDAVGNSTGAKFHIHYHPPTAIVQYSPGSGVRTSGNVVGTLTGFNTTGITVINNSGLFTYTFTGNNSFTFQFTDINGHVGTTTGTVSWIDRTPPTFTGVVDGGMYFEHPTIYFSDENLSGAILSGLNGNSYFSGDFQNGSTVAHIGEDFIFTVYDLAGNSTGATFEIETSLLGFSGITSGGIYSGVTIIYTFTGDMGEWMSGVVISGLNNAYYSGDFSSGWTEKTRVFNEEGTFSFTMYEADGEITGAIFTIYKTAPTILGVTSGGIYNSPTINFSGLYFSGAILSGLDNSYYSGNFQTGVFTDGSDGTYMITVYDSIGNSTGLVFTIDRTPPTFTGVVTGGIYDYSASGIIISFADNNTGVTAILTIYSLSGDIISSGARISGTPLIASGHYNYELVVTDIAGNSTGASFHIHYLTFTTVYIPGSGARTSGNVLAYLTGFSESVTGFNSTGYIFTGNGSFQFSFYHPEGFDTHYSTATVYWIDKELPTFTGVIEGNSYNTGVQIFFTDNNTGVTATISGGIYTGGLYTSGTNITGEGQYIVTIIDIVGNIVLIHFSIDFGPPSATVIYSPGSGARINQDVTVTLTGFNETLTGFNVTGYIFTGNGSFIFTFEDLAGNTGSTTATVDWIDKISPTFTGIATGGYYDIYPTIYFSDDHLSGAILSGTNNSYYSGDFQNGGTFVADGKFIFTVYDLAGNSTGASFRMHTSILGFSGVVTGGYYNTDVTIDYWLDNQDPECSLSGATLSGLNGNTYYSGDFQSGSTVTGEGIYKFTVYEVDGDRTGAIFTIDKTSPIVASIDYVPISGDMTSGQVSAILTGISEPIIILNNDGSGTVIFYDNGEFTFEFVDLAGNPGSVTAYVWRIKPNLGTITGAEFSTGYTSNIQHIGGYDTGVESLVTVTVSNDTGILYKNGVALSGFITTGMRDDEFYIVLNSSPNPLTTVTSTMTIESIYGIITGDFIVTTKDTILDIAGPASFDFGIRGVSDSIQTIEKTFSGENDYFKIIDKQGFDTGYYTTLSMSDMINGSGDILPYTMVAVKALSGIVTLSGTENPNIYSAITGIYQYFTASPLTFISRDTADNKGYTGTYGIQTTRKIDIPTMQNIGNYTGVITYTLY